METKNIMIVGVGGQGTLLASKLLGKLLLDAGYDVKVSEVHGMSQRGGSVVTYIRYGANVASPIIDKGCADYIISFELLEAARWLPYLKKGGKLISNCQQVDPMPVITGAAKYPEGLEKAICEAAPGADIIDACAIAEKAGSSKAINIALLGRASCYFDFSEDQWVRALVACVPPRFIELNKTAFLLAKNL